MKITLLCIGKTNSPQLLELMNDLEKRLPAFINYERKELPDIKNAKKLSISEIKNMEFEILNSKITSTDTLTILDERGKEFTSVQFSEFINNNMINSTKHLIFCIGGSYGFSEKIYTLNPQKISLSKMTFTHQMARLFFTEQLYRAFSIIQGKPYHNE